MCKPVFIHVTGWLVACGTLDSNNRPILRNPNNASHPSTFGAMCKVAYSNHDATPLHRQSETRLHSDNLASTQLSNKPTLNMHIFFPSLSKRIVSSLTLRPKRNFSKLTIHCTAYKQMLNKIVFRWIVPYVTDTNCKKVERAHPTSTALSYFLPLEACFAGSATCFLCFRFSSFSR
jgi:hypothetical protein